MPNRAFREIVTRLAPSVPGAPNVVVEQYVRDAAIEACERTLACAMNNLRYDLTQAGMIMRMTHRIFLRCMPS